MTMPYAFVFPGQGSQHLGLLAKFAKAFPEEVNRAFDLASEATSYRLWKIAQEGPEEILNQTQFTQPILLAASVAVWRVWEKRCPQLPIFLAGHSLGEYSALVCSGVMDYFTTVKMVKLRGNYMQKAVPLGKGAMAAILGLDETAVAEICRLASQDNDKVSPANFNTLGQIVIAGKKNAVERAIEIAMQQGAKLAKLLPVSVPAHCDLMYSAAQEFGKQLSAIIFEPPKIPVINNVDATCYSEPQKIRDALTRQLYNPVRWVETVQLLAEHKVGAIIESGPGKVLTGLNKRLVKDISCLAIGEPDTFQEALNSIEAHNLIEESE